jgi:sporadic carbohydrate cluster 2OG-Fe(II) oxygenase
MQFSEQFLTAGYAVVPVDHIEPLLRLRGEIFERAKAIFEYSGNDAERFFNEFHTMQITGPRLNELRVKLIGECTRQVESGRLIFEALREKLVALLGPDLLVQKNTNLVIQQPGDPNPSEVHRDAPTNSPYEIVVWLPLVNCFRSKCMYVCDRSKTLEALSIMKSNPDDWSAFERFCAANGVEPDVPFGSALLFWTGLFHGSRINSEGETRWSLNMRYKNLFSPTGLKDAFEFFRILQLSPLARLGIEFQKSQVIA